MLTILKRRLLTKDELELIKDIMNESNFVLYKYDYNILSFFNEKIQREFMNIGIFNVDKKNIKMFICINGYQNGPDCVVYLERKDEKSDWELKNIKRLLIQEID